MLKTALVHVSCIQIIQVRDKTTAKVFGKVDTFWTYQAHAGSYVVYLSLSWCDLIVIMGIVI